MKKLRIVSLTAATSVLGAIVALGGSIASANATSGTTSCASLTKALIVSDGFTKAAAPRVTPYNYATGSSNAPNAMGTTYDFGSHALVVGCVSPSDIKKLSVMAQGRAKPTMTASQYMAYVVKQSSGAMTKTPVAGVNDFLDFGSGKEDGLGSTSKAGSVRLDAWIAGKYIFLGFSSPVSSSPPKALINFIKSTEHLF